MEIDRLAFVALVGVIGACGGGSAPAPQTNERMIGTHARLTAGHEVNHIPGTPRPAHECDRFMESPCAEGERSARDVCLAKWNADASAHASLTACIEDAFSQPAMQQPFPSPSCAKKTDACDDAKLKCLPLENGVKKCDEDAHAKCPKGDPSKLSACMDGCQKLGHAAPAFEACTKKCASSAGITDCKAFVENACTNEHAQLAKCEHDSSQACNTPECAREAHDHCKARYDVAWRCTTR
jgi:hypothetical protein